MKNNSFDDDRFISSGQLWREEDEKTMMTSVSCTEEKEEEFSFSKTLEDFEDDDRSVWTPRGGKEEKREEGLSKTVMLTRPKGGKRYLCMDSEEIKACKDLGFELEEDKLKFEVDATMMPNAPSASTSNADWRISNPGDDPRDVKARLKLWAQAVAQASSSRRVRG